MTANRIHVTVEKLNLITLKTFQLFDSDLALILTSCSFSNILRQLFYPVITLPVINPGIIDFAERFG